MDNFTKAEQEGRRKLQRDYESSPVEIDYIFTRDQYDPIDSFCTAYTPAGTHIYANEIKNRDIPLAKYAEKGIMLELYKYEHLMAAHDNSGYTPCYINYFNDNTRVTWNLADIDITDRVIEMPCTKTTAENYGKEKINKKVILLSINEGTIKKYGQ